MNQKQTRKGPSTLNRNPKAKPKKISTSNHAGQSLIGKTRPGSSRASTAVDETEMAGLPQFCATCEKQIVTPGSSVLYCSESCRKTDSTSSTTLHMKEMNPSYFDSREPQILPPLSPTILRPASLKFFDPASSNEDSDDSDGHSGSEAYRYLAQFHSRSYSTERVRTRRPRPNRVSSATEAIPSLTHTPSSSIGTMASTDRPLPGRHGRTTSHKSSKSVELVLPSCTTYSRSISKQALGDTSVGSTDSNITIIPESKEVSKSSFQRQPMSPEDYQQVMGGLQRLFNGDTVTNPTGNEGEPGQDASVGI